MQSKAWQEMVDLGGRVCEVVGLPRSAGQIFGLLYFSLEPLSLNQMSSLLGISKASVCTSSRNLVSFGAIRKVWVPGDRRDYYLAEENVNQLIRGSYRNLIKPRIKSSQGRLHALKSTFKKELQSGVLPIENKEVLTGRIRTLEKFHNRITQFLPLLEKIMK